MALGMEVGLGPGHIVLDGDPDPLPKKGTEPQFLAHFLLWSNGLMQQDAIWYYLFKFNSRLEAHGIQS